MLRKLDFVRCVIVRNPSFCTALFALLLLTLKQYRVAMSKLRVSSHRLLIESGRWNKPQPIPRNERLCQIATNWKMNTIFYWSVPFLPMKERNILNRIM